MSVQGLNWQTWAMRFTAGMNQGTDARALDLSELSILKDAQFDKLSGLQTRFPYAAALSSNIVGGGTVSNPRRVVAHGNELLLFTKDTLYSWKAQASQWMTRGAHLAVKVDEVSRFVRTAEQISADRAELDNTIVYAWNEGTGIWVACIDKTTQAVVFGPQNINQGDTLSRPRLVAGLTRIGLFYSNATTGSIDATAIDPDNLENTIDGNSTDITSGTHDLFYDVAVVPGTDNMIVATRLNPTTSYEITKWNASTLAITTSTKARVCDGPIAVSASPNGTHAQIVRTDTGNIVGDLVLVSTLADVFTAQAVGTFTTAFTCNQIAAAHRSVQNGGQYRCYVFWSSEETTGAVDFETKSNWVDTGNTLGSQARLVRHLGVASRAFDHDGRIFVWMAFSGESSFSGANYDGFRAQLQNSYFLYRDDATFHARAAFQKAGGFSSSRGHLPGVANVGTNQYAWCGIERRIINLGDKQTSYAAREPRDIIFTFDSNEARRTARLGSTLYITGSEVMQYDGSGLYEVGYHIYPWYFGAIEVPAGNLVDGLYALQNTYRWHNAAGEVDRSTTATTGTVTIAAGPNGISIVTWKPLYVTHKSGIAIEVWRTFVNPLPDSPFYLSSSKDPTDTSNPNRYIENDTTGALLATFNDELVDADLGNNETHFENGDVLENLAPPPAAIIVAGPSRLFLAGLSDAPYTIRYSKQRNEGEVAAFHEALSVDVPPTGGPICALAFLNETLIALCDTAIWALPGDGFDNAGGGINYGPARQLSIDIGTSDHDSVAVIDKGVIFKSAKGWYLLNHGWSLDYIGGPISDYDSEPPLAINVIESQHQVRILTASRMLVFDTLASEAYQRPTWAEWTISSGLHACMWNGSHVYLTSTGPRVQGTTYTGVDYGMDVELAWLKLNDLQGYGSIDFLQLLGEFRSACTVRVRLARDYWKDGDGTYFQDKTHTPSSTAGKPFELQHYPSIKQVKALKVRITITQTAAGESLKLTGLAFKLGIQPGLNRNIAIGSKQ